MTAMPAMAARAVDPSSLDEVIKRVQEHQKKTTTLQADFKQEKTLALLSKPEVSTGRFTYQKPNNVLWTYDAPKRVTMLIANGMMTTYYPDLNKAEQIEVKPYQDRIFKYMGPKGPRGELGTYFNLYLPNPPQPPGLLLHPGAQDQDHRQAREAHPHLDRQEELPDHDVRVHRR